MTSEPPLLTVTLLPSIVTILLSSPDLVAPDADHVMVIVLPKVVDEIRSEESFVEESPSITVSGASVSLFSGVSGLILSLLHPQKVINKGKIKKIKRDIMLRFW